VVVGGSCDAMRSGIGMTITLPGHRMSATQHYFNLDNWTILFGLSTHLHRFQVFECDLYI